MPNRTGSLHPEIIRKPPHHLHHPWNTHLTLLFGDHKHRTRNLWVQPRLVVRVQATHENTIPIRGPAIPTSLLGENAIPDLFFLFGHDFRVERGDAVIN